jgi:hypothetical protein
MVDPAEKLPHELLEKIVRELSVLASGDNPRTFLPSYDCDGLGGLAVCSREWMNVVVEVMYTVGIIKGKDLLSMRRYCMKLDLSFLFESFKAIEFRVEQNLLRHIVQMCCQDRLAPHCESFNDGLKAVFDAAILAYRRVRISTNEPRRVCLQHAASLCSSSS